MELGDRLGIAGIIVAFVALGITIMWPTKRPIAYVCFLIAGILGAWWLYAEHRVHPKEVVASPEQSKQLPADTELLKQSLAHAGVSHKELEEIESQFRTDQRPWVMVENVEGKMELGKLFNPEVIVKNFGKTPAIDVTVKAFMDALPAGQPPDFGEIAILNLHVDLGPGQENATGFSALDKQPVNDTAIYHMASGQEVETLWGRISYHDILGVPHWTEFCSQLDFKSQRYGVCPGNLNKVDRKR